MSLVTYNAELRVFSSVQVSLSFTGAGEVTVLSTIATVSVEPYRTMKVHQPHLAAPPAPPASHALSSAPLPAARQPAGLLPKQAIKALAAGASGARASAPAVHSAPLRLLALPQDFARGGLELYFCVLWFFSVRGQVKDAQLAHKTGQLWEHLTSIGSIVDFLNFTLSFIEIVYWRASPIAHARAPMQLARRCATGIRADPRTTSSSARLSWP